MSAPFASRLTSLTNLGFNPITQEDVGRDGQKEQKVKFMFGMGHDTEQDAIPYFFLLCYLYLWCYLYLPFPGTT